jgi:predicted anti-sigma-YlaC factor YlaD
MQLPSSTRRWLSPPLLLGAALWLVVGASGCSIRQMAINRVGDALAATGAGGGGAFGRDDDPELIAAAVPFSLKLMESLLDESPRHEGLLLATASGFTQFAYAFVQQEADRLDETDFAAAQAQRQRARRLYLRARDYGLRGIEVRHRGFAAQLARDPAAAVARAQRRDVPVLYWTAAAWAAAIAVSKDDPAAIGEVPQMEALIDRARALDPDWGRGTIHGFLIAYEMARVDGEGAAVDRARQHYRRAVELSGGQLAGPHLTWAEAVCVPRQDAAGFRAALAAALAIDPNASPDDRLANVIFQRRARWLLERIDELFLEP